MKTQCPNCKARFNVNDKFVGKQAKCPKCANPFTIQPFVETPAKSPAPVEPPAPATPPVKIPEPVVPPVKIAAPVEAPAKVAAPITPPAKVTAPKKPPVKIAEPAKEEKPESKAPIKSGLSKTVFVYCWIVVRIIAGVLAALGLMLATRKGAHSTLMMTFAAADVFLLCSVAVELMLYYKMWSAIADSEASISPGKAIGFLFIPVFNIYWALLMFTGFTEDYNLFIHRRSLKTKDLSFILFLGHAVMFILAAIFLTTPMICIFRFVGLIGRAFISYTNLSWALFFFIFAVGFCHFITYILVAIKTCNAINALQGKKGG
jgi:predicted Zn finger-like uncharacterized protein